jgi:hypothetical protein
MPSLPQGHLLIYLALPKEFRNSLWWMAFCLVHASVDGALRTRENANLTSRPRYLRGNEWGVFVDTQPISRTPNIAPDFIRTAAQLRPGHRTADITKLANHHRFCMRIPNLAGGATRVLALPIH